MSYKIPFIRPDFPSAEEISQDYARIVESNWYTNFGPFERRFAQAVDSYLGNELHTSLVSNATIGLMLAIRAVFPDDKKKVLMPSFTFAAGAEALLWCGYTPVLIDLDPETWQPSLDGARSYISEHSDEIAGILLCNTFGVGNPNIEGWNSLSAQYRLPVVIDSAAGFGSRYADGRPVGVAGNCEIFSFHATKPFSIGEGGAVVSHSTDLQTTLNQLQNFGFGANREVEHIGLNAKVTEFSSAIGLRQLEKLDARLEHRQASLKHYQTGMESLGYGFQPNVDRSSVCFASALSPSPKIAVAFLSELEAAGVEARTYYNPPLHRHRGLSAKVELWGPQTVTEDICARIISLPVHDDMKLADIEAIVALARKASTRP